MVEIWEAKSSGTSPDEVKISFTRDSIKASRLVLSRSSEDKLVFLDCWSLKKSTMLPELIPDCSKMLFSWLKSWAGFRLPPSEIRNAWISSWVTSPLPSVSMESKLSRIFCPLPVCSAWFWTSSLFNPPDRSVSVSLKFCWDRCSSVFKAVCPKLPVPST